MECKLQNPELEAEIYYLTTEESGRKSAILSGYLDQFHYDEKDWDAVQEFINKNICNVGETVKVYLQTLSPNNYLGKLFIGKKFEIREGKKIVGIGKITKVLRSDFYKNSVSKDMETILLEKIINTLQKITDEGNDKYVFFVNECREIIIEYKNNGGTQQKAFETLYSLFNLYNNRNMEAKHNFIAGILDIIVGNIGNRQMLIWEEYLKI